MGEGDVLEGDALEGDALEGDALDSAASDEDADLHGESLSQLADDISLQIGELEGNSVAPSPSAENVKEKGDDNAAGKEKEDDIEDGLGQTSDEPTNDSEEINKEM